MKAKMKKLISIKSMPMLALGMLIILGTALAASREPISISGVVDLSSFTGTATVTIGGETYSGTVAIIPLADPEPRDGGTYFPVVEHWFTFPNGSIVTTGEAFAMPMDENSAVSTLHGNMEIILESAINQEIQTTGEFEGASGELRVNGQIDWPPIPQGQATFEAHGVISR